jgi:hypothetical protein
MTLESPVQPSSEAAGAMLWAMKGFPWRILEIILVQVEPGPVSMKNLTPSAYACSIRAGMECPRRAWAQRDSAMESGSILRGLAPLEEYRSMPLMSWVLLVENCL